MPKRCRPLLGTFVEIAADREDAIDEAFDAVAQVHRLMSVHEPHSDVSLVNRFAHRRAVEVHEWTARALERALYWTTESEGAFDPLRAGYAAIEHRLISCHPDQPRPEAAHWTCLQLQCQSVRLMKPACIDLGGIAKGFAVDRAVETLRNVGCLHGLVNAGGDLRAFGPDAWPITIVEPHTGRACVEVRIEDEALATSAGLRGDAALSFDHIGGPNRRWASVTVLARTACDADALTKLVWSGSELVPRALRRAGARAIGITHDGTVESISRTRELAA